MASRNSNTSLEPPSPRVSRSADTTNTNRRRQSIARKKSIIKSNESNENVESSKNSLSLIQEEQKIT